ncbi:hypothetical protein Hanom_Chr11g01057761 [Helianthus anomalus]
MRLLVVCHRIEVCIYIVICIIEGGRKHLFFFLTAMNPLNELLVKFTTSGYTHLQTEEYPHLGPKLVNTCPKARQCGEVKPAHFNDRTSDLGVLA